MIKHVQEQELKADLNNQPQLVTKSDGHVKIIIAEGVLFEQYTFGKGNRYRSICRVPMADNDDVSLDQIEFIYQTHNI